MLILVLLILVVVALVPVCSPSRPGSGAATTSATPVSVLCNRLSIICTPRSTGDGR
jgi:hypothetical protein